MDPSDYVANGDIDLTLELFDQNAWADELICAGNISILRYMVEAGGVVETVSLKVPGEDRADTLPLAKLEALGQRLSFWVKWSSQLGERSSRLMF